MFKSSLESLENRIAEELALINYPPGDWLKPDPAILDVAIIGAGMAGIAAAFALLKVGISKIKLFDCSQTGLEGPWVTYARMKTLRSTKELTGPAHDFPLLTFQAWYQAKFGQKEWDSLIKIPNRVWMDYLQWFGSVLKLPIQNNSLLTLIKPEKQYLSLFFDETNGQSRQTVRKVVLATGRGGFGGPKIPSFVKHLPKKYYSHTTEWIDFFSLKEKRIGIVGIGASGFDAAAAALEHGAQTVDMFMRRASIANINKFAHTVYPGFSLGFYYLSEESKLKFLHCALDQGATPPHESLERIAHYRNFQIHSNFIIEKMTIEEDAVKIVSNQGSKVFDFLILATGFEIDGSKQPELQMIFDKIELWKDRKGIPSDLLNGYGNFPYLGAGFEFLGKDLQSANELKNIYCFNYGATASHALLSSDIPGIGIGSERLAQAIAKDFFISNHDYYLQNLQEFATEEFPPMRTN